MNTPLQLSSTERRALILFAAFGMLAVNGAFLYAVFAAPELLDEAMRNPIALAFIVEAFALVVLIGWLLRRAGLTRVGLPLFVLLSILGSLAFSLPVAVLLPPSSPGGSPRPSE